MAGKQNKTTAIYMHEINGGSTIIKMSDCGDYATALPQKECMDNRLPPEFHITVMYSCQKVGSKSIIGPQYHGETTAVDREVPFAC